MSTEFTRTYDWTDDRDASTPINATRMDVEMDDMTTKLNQKCVIKATAPSSPIEGMLWLDSTNKLLKQYRNSEWVVMGCVHVATAAPTTAQEGDLFFNTTTNRLYAYQSASLSREIITTDHFGTVGQLLYSGGLGSAPISLSFGTGNQILCSQGIESAPLFRSFPDVLSDTMGTGYVNAEAMATGAAWRHSLTSVFNNTAPTSWTDLDLSAVVGANRALVFLRVKPTGANLENFNTRINGDDTEEVGSGAVDRSGGNEGYIVNGRISYFFAVTDASGIIEWKASNAVSTQIWVQGYIK